MWCWFRHWLWLRTAPDWGAAEAPTTEHWHGFRAQHPVVALVFEDELVATLPRDAWDRPVTAVVQPTGLTELPRLDVE